MDHCLRASYDAAYPTAAAQSVLSVLAAFVVFSALAMTFFAGGVSASLSLWYFGFLSFRSQSSSTYPPRHDLPMHAIKTEIRRILTNLRTILCDLRPSQRLPMKIRISYLGKLMRNTSQGVKIRPRVHACRRARVPHAQSGKFSRMARADIKAQTAPLLQHHHSALTDTVSRSADLPESCFNARSSSPLSPPIDSSLSIPPERPPARNPTFKMPATDRPESISGAPLPSHVVVTSPMPFPSQTGALFFDRDSISEFLRKWKIQAETFGLSEQQKCLRLPDYCSSALKLVIEALPGYAECDWDALERQLKDTFRRYDTQDKSEAALEELLSKSDPNDLRFFVLQYASISAFLVSEGLMSASQRVAKLLDSHCLPIEIRRRAFRFCQNQEWHLRAWDAGTKPPNFSELQGFLLKECTYEDNLAGWPQKPSTEYKPSTENRDILEVPTRIATPERPIAVPNLPARPPTADPIAELTAKLDAMSLLLQSRPPAPASAFSDRPLRCFHCDSPDHRKMGCPLLQQDIDAGLVRLNALSRLVNPATGEEYPSMFGRGGIRALIRPATGANTIPLGERSSRPSVNFLTLESADHTASLGNDSSVYSVTMLGDGMIAYNRLDADVEEKRKFDGTEAPRNVRMKPVVEIPARRPAPPTLPLTPPPPPAADRRPVPEPDVPLVVPRDNSAPVYSRNERYRLVSDISKTIEPSALLNQMLDVNLPVRIREILAVAPEVGNELVNLCRKKRIPVPDVSTHAIAANSLSIATLDPLYSCGSPYIRTTLNGKVAFDALIDSGSEVNIMSMGLLELLDIGVDTEVKWEIGTLAGKVTSCIGVVHGLTASVGGIEVPIHCFVVDTPQPKLILGRPWERTARAKTDNRDDGSLWYKVYSPDGRRMVEFCAVRPDNPRNREFACDPIPSTSGEF